MDDNPPPKPAAKGAPGWVTTFADLMSLLMCFFVLLLAFSEMDVLKFKQLAGSMREAFGVQREIKAKEIPKGTSIIAREFSPGRPDPTLLVSVRQHTVDDLQQNLRVADETRDDQSTIGETAKAPVTVPDGTDEQSALGAPAPRYEVDASDVKEALAEDIEMGMVDVATLGERIIIRIRERGSFPSGAADLMPAFEPVLARIGAVLTQTRGRIVIAGHSDDVPISTARFRSNWELSASRAVSVVEHLAVVTRVERERFLIEGHADTAPLAPNDSAENRALNRRVEIVIVRGEADVDGGEITSDLPATQQ